MELILDKNKKKEHLYLEVFPEAGCPLFENVRRN